jgi:hypothetical protein
VRQQQLRHLDIVGVRGLVERREAALLLGVGIRPRLEQQPHRLAVVRRRGGVDGANAELVVRVVVGIGAVLEQEAHDVRPAHERGEPERREALGRPLGARVRIRLEQLAHALRAPRRRGLEDAELGLGLQQRVRHLALAVEEREQHDRQAAPVARRRQRRVLADQPAHRLDVAVDDRGEQLIGHWRTIPHTRSDTSLVNAASWKNDFGFRREVSENVTVPASSRTL